MFLAEVGNGTTQGAFTTMNDFNMITLLHK